MQYLLIPILNCFFASLSFANEAPKPWSIPQVDCVVAETILYLPIAEDSVQSMTIEAIDETIVDLLKINHPRIKALSSMDPRYPNTYEGFSKVRLGVYKKLLNMLGILPKNIGIAYFEGLRPLWKQKEYFDRKFQEILKDIKNKELAYQETAKHVSPFIDNIPTHATGAAIDMTLFEVNDGEAKLIDMGMFDTIYGHNPQQETFSKNTTEQQRKNRLILLHAAIGSGFVNYGFEWWHYSYGDKAWAYVKHQKAIYGLAVDENDPTLSINKDSYVKGFE